MVSRIPAVWYRLLLSRLDSVIKVVPEKRQVSARKKDVIVLIPARILKIRTALFLGHNPR